MEAQHLQRSGSSGLFDGENCLSFHGSPSLCLRKRQPSLRIGPLLKKNRLTPGSLSSACYFREPPAGLSGAQASRAWNSSHSEGQDLGPRCPSGTAALTYSLCDPGNLSAFLLHEEGQSFKMVTNKDN